MAASTSLVHRTLAFVLVFAPACGSSSPRVCSPDGALARVTLTDVTVGISKSDGSPWDGPGMGVTPDDTAAVVSALGAADPFVAVSAVLAGPAIAALDKPEVTGHATLFLRASPQPPQKFHGQRDATRPMLSPQPTWLHVPLDCSARIELDLVDADLTYDDPIGSLIISGEALAAAATAGKLYQFKVSDQTSNTVLFVGVSVIPE